MPPLRLLAAFMAVPLAACTTMDAGPDSAAVCPPTRGWTAFVNAMPGPGAEPTLIVTGEVDVPEGMVAGLESGPVDRMMPPGARFALDLRPGTGATGWQTVRAEVRPALTAYSSIIVGCGAQTLARIENVETAY